MLGQPAFGRGPLPIASPDATKWNPGRDGNWAMPLDFALLHPGCTLNRGRSEHLANRRYLIDIFGFSDRMYAYLG